MKGMVVWETSLCADVASNCKYWSWFSKRNETGSRQKECYTKTSNIGRVVKIGVVSGSRDCEEQGRSEYFDDWHVDILLSGLKKFLLKIDAGSCFLLESFHWHT